MARWPMGWTRWDVFVVVAIGCIALAVLILTGLVVGLITP